MYGFVLCGIRSAERAEPDMIVRQKKGSNIVCVYCLCFYFHRLYFLFQVKTKECYRVARNLAQQACQAKVPGARDWRPEAMISEVREFVKRERER